MAIAFDTATAIANVTTPTATQSHTITGTNPILFVGVYTSAPGTITGVTWGGVALTFVNGATQGGNARVENWRLYAPATGTANVVVSQSGSVNIGGVISSYTGVAQSSAIDQTTTSSGNSTSTDTTVTTAFDNEWVISVCWTNRGNSNGTNGIIRAGATSQFSLYDSNAPKTPAGSITSGVTFTSATWASAMVSFKVNTAVTTGNFFPLL